MEVDRIDHVCFATRDTKKVSDAFESLTGKRPMFLRDHTDDDGIKETVFIYPYGFRIHESTDASKFLGGLIEDLDEGIYCISMYCDDIDKTTAMLESMGYAKLREALALAEAARTSIFDTMDDLGFYIELIQDINLYEYGQDKTEFAK